jgi:hypothetical protein
MEVHRLNNLLLHHTPFAINQRLAVGADELGLDESLRCSFFAFALVGLVGTCPEAREELRGLMSTRYPLFVQLTCASGRVRRLQVEQRSAGGGARGRAGGSATAPTSAPASTSSSSKRATPGWRARRWVVEACHSWLNRNRTLLIRWSKKPENHLALLQLACGLISFKKAHAARLAHALPG